MATTVTDRPTFTLAGIALLYAQAHTLSMAQISAVLAGNMTPTYSFYDDNRIGLSDFYSRWRCQLGVKLVF